MVHDGHRGRLKQRFLEHGLDSFDDHNALELLLFYAVPRRDTNELAHRLIDSFGSLDRVLDARPEELMAVPGVGEGIVTLLRLVPAIEKRAAIERASMTDVLPDVRSVGAYLIPRFRDSRTENVLVLCLDTKYKVLDCRPVGRGGITSAEFSMREVAQIALQRNASFVVLAHNHTSGIALPSAEDKDVTKKVQEILGYVGVRLIDHIIVAGDDFISLADDGLL